MCIRDRIKEPSDIFKLNYEKIKTFTITSSNDDGKRDLIIVKGTWETKANNYFYLVLKMEMKLKLVIKL